MSLWGFTNFGIARKRSMGKKILIVLHGSIGDVTRALPLANVLRRAFPNARITWSIEPPALPVLENHPAIDEIIVFDRKLWWKSLVPFLRQIRGGDFDLVLDLQRLLKSGFVSWWSGAPYRLGFHRLDSKEGNWLFNNHHIPLMGDRFLKLSHYLKFADFIGIHQAPVEWKLQCTPLEEENVTKRLQAIDGRFAVFFVGARWESKIWFPYQTALSASEVHRRYGLAIVLLGGSDDVQFAREVESYGMVRLTNWVGKSSLREAIGIFSNSDLSDRLREGASVVYLLQRPGGEVFRPLHTVPFVKPSRDLLPLRVHGLPANHSRTVPSFSPQKLQGYPASEFPFDVLFQ